MVSRPSAREQSWLHNRHVPTEKEGYQLFTITSLTSSMDGIAETTNVTLGWPSLQSGERGSLERSRLCLTWELKYFLFIAWAKATEQSAPIHYIYAMLKWRLHIQFALQFGNLFGINIVPLWGKKLPETFRYKEEQYLANQVKFQIVKEIGSVDASILRTKWTTHTNTHRHTLCRLKANHSNWRLGLHDYKTERHMSSPEVGGVKKNKQG